MTRASSSARSSSVRSAKKPRNGCPIRLRAPGGQQVLGGGIGVAHHVIVIQHDDRRGEQVQAGERGVGHSHPLELRPR
jgi:hypothetical protein